MERSRSSAGAQLPFRLLAFGSAVPGLRGFGFLGLELVGAKQLWGLGAGCWVFRWCGSWGLGPSLSLEHRLIVPWLMLSSIFCIR